MMKKAIYIFFCLLVSTVVVLAGFIVIPMDEAPAVSEQGPFAIEHVNVVNVRDGSITPARTVLVDQGIITGIHPSKDYQHGTRYKSIQAEGKYLTPGLWDMHTHSLKLSPQLHHPLFIANGVTSARDMSGCMHQNDSNWGCISDRIKWTAQALTGNGVSPRYVLQSSYQTNGGNEVPEGFPAFFKLQQAGDAEKLAEFYDNAGADFIKVYSELSLKQYDQLVAASSRRGMSVAGHRPLVVPLEHALNSSQRTIEHPRLFLLECYRNIEDFRKLDNPLAHYNAEFMKRLMADHDGVKCQRLMSQMAASDTWWVPTLGILKNSAYSTDEHFLSDKRQLLIPDIAKQLLWFPDIKRASNHVEVHRDFFEQAKIHVKQAHDQGVKLLVGSDSIDTFIYTGSSLHDELKMMVEAGLSPLEALQAATLSAAQFSGMADRTGTVETGKNADLLLLDGNPLEDIGHTQNLSGVMFGGHYYDKSALQTLTGFVEEQANTVQVNVRYLWDMLASPLWRVQIAD